MSDSRFRERRSAHVDEDEAGAAKPAEEHADVGAGAGEQDRSEPEPAERPQPAPEIEETIGDLPEPSFLEIVQYLAFQAIQFLGDMPLNEAGERRVLPREAKHFIDLLGILEERTRGNLTPEESRFLGQILADLRVRYLEIGA